MKKALFMFATLVAALGFTSCSDDSNGDEKNKLATPMLTAPQVTHNSASISWTKVDNANQYVYTLNDGNEMVTEEPSVNLTGLTPSTSYTFKVKARKDKSEYFEDSEYTQVDFTTNAEPVVAKAYHVAEFGDDWDTWFYTYNADWTPKRIYRTVDGTKDGELDREWVFAYNGKDVAVTGKNEWTIKLNDAGYVEELIDGDKTYTYAYDGDGYLIQVTKNGEIVVNVTIENGNIAKWSKLKDGAEVWKLHTYDSSLANVGGCHAICAEGIGASRWLVESGLFGKANANLHLTNQWDYSEKGSTFTFEFDANGCVSAEHKTYGEDVENFHYVYVAE